MQRLLIILLTISSSLGCKSKADEGLLPLVINTWNFSNATIQAWDAVNRRGLRAIDAIVEGCSVCERQQCDGTVGFGGSPDEHGETTLDAMIMDGKTMNIGAVAALRNIKNAIEVARHVLENTKHTLLVGDQATDFAVMMGFKKEPLSTTSSTKMWKDWSANHCQPNFWENVIPNPSMSCGPYSPVSENSIDKYFNVNTPIFDSKNHDTIGMIVIDQQGNISSGTSTNGARNKIPGRVGDSPIPGAGSYADNNVGAATATGDGDIMMRFLPSLLAVEHMRQSKTPREAGELALKRIALYYPKFMGAIVVTDKKGNYAAACHGFSEFPYSVYNPQTKDVIVEKVKCFTF